MSGRAEREGVSLVEPSKRHDKAQFRGLRTLSVTQYRLSRKMNLGMVAQEFLVSVQVHSD